MMGLLNLDRLIGLVIGFILSWAVLAAVNQFVWLPAARNEGRDIERAAVLKQAMKNIEQRGKTNAEIRVLNDGALCRELGGIWVPENNVCE
jgi:hypothetical protein